MSLELAREAGSMQGRGMEAELAVAADLGAHSGAGDLPEQLRARTHAAHTALEGDLDLLREPLSRDRFTHVLSRFRGFHAAWEPAASARPDLQDLLAGRGRLAALDRDLISLGLMRGAIEALPPCDAAAGLCRTREGALGSLYVLEGSTLGGAVIARALAQAPWSPPGGLAYFNGYGPKTGALWRELKAQLRREPQASTGAIVAGALGAFALLRAWTAPVV